MRLAVILGLGSLLLVRGLGPVFGRSVVTVADFERPDDRRLVRTRKPATLSTDISSHGKRSLKIQTGDYLNIETPRLGRARPGDLLRMDLFNATPAPQSVRIEIFDAGSRKSYWHRHVRQYALRPGWNTLSFTVARLYSGEKNSRRIADAYLDPAAIRRVDLAFGKDGPQGAICIDHIRFEPDPQMPRVSGLRAFDFGPENQAVRHGFTACSRQTYTERRGHGWSSPGWPKAVRDYIHPNPLLADFREAAGQTFSVRVPNGAWQVRVYFEDHGWWEDQFARFTRRTIRAEGRQVHKETLTVADAARRFYRFADLEPGSHTRLYDVYIRDGRYKPKAFDVNVADGRLDLRFDCDGRMACRVSAIILWPASEAVMAARWFVELDRRMRDEFDAENVYFSSAPRGRRLADLSDARPADGLVVFSAGRTTPTGPDYIPLKGERLSRLDLFAAPGQDVGASFSVVALSGGGELKLAMSMQTLRPELFHVRNRLRRRGGGYTIVPDILVPLGEKPVGADRTRQFWLEIPVPAGTRPGTYRGELALAYGGAKRTLPVSVEVLPIELSKPKLAFGLFGLMPDYYAPAGALEQVVEQLKNHGVSSVAGVPLGEVRAREGAVEVDFSRADAVMLALKKAGFVMAVDTYGGGGLSGVASAAKALKKPVPQVFKEAMARVREHARAAGWLPFSYSMVDEPHWSDDAVRRATQAVVRANAGAPGLLTNGYWSPKADRAAHRALMDALGRTTMSRVTRAAVKYLKSRDRRIGFYGGRSRHEFGLRQWAALAEGFDAHYAWHFHVRYGDPYYDLDGREPDVCMVYFTPRRARASLGLKALRSGAFDFLYLQTLSDALNGARAARGGVSSGPAAGAAEKLLAQARAAGNIYRERSAPRIADLDVFRRQVADAVLKLLREKGQ